MERHSLKKFNPLYSFPMYAVEQFYPGLYDKFIFVSDITKKKTMQRVKRQAKVCHVIPNGIGEELLTVVPEENDYILFLSRIDIYTKGLDVLVRAFEKLSTSYPELRLVLAGYEFDTVDSLLSGLPLTLKERIQYAGFVSGEEKLNLLTKAKLFVLPSRHESAPISILEAAACGKPVIVSDIPELDFVRSEKIGLIFPSGSIEGLIDRIDCLLKDEKARKTMGNCGRDYAGKFLWNRIAMDFENGVKQAIIR
jgi:glycosyltransferase involved in cell wall biosynthesis